jgi:glycerol-3-phosphate dehydrogenase
MGRSYFINRKKTLARLPMLIPTGLKGGVVYHDGQFDDSRMVLALAQSCVGKGGTVLNYIKVTDLLKDENGRINGVRAVEIISGYEFDLKANLVINATGVFAEIYPGWITLNRNRLLNPVRVFTLFLTNLFLTVIQQL